MRMNKKSQQYAAFGFGVVFVVSLLLVAIFLPEPTPFQYVVFKTILALAAAGVAAMIPGFLEVTISDWVRAGGALGVFVVVYFYNPAALIAKPPPKEDSNIELVEYSVSYEEDEPILVPEVDVKFRNTGDQVAFLKALEFELLGEATLEACGNPAYSLVPHSATYDIDLLNSPRKAVSHAIKPADTDRIKVRVFRDKGGPTLTVYRVTLNVVYDEDDKITSSEPFFLKMTGPISAEASYTPGVSEEAWYQCVQRNIDNFNSIDYQIYTDQEEILEKIRELNLSAK